MNNQAIEAYKNTSFEAAPPLKIVRMLYAGVLRFIEQAQDIDPMEDGPSFNSRVSRADAIVSELRCAIDSTHSPELAAQLEQLYAFVETQINRAVVERSCEPLHGAHQVLTTLKAAWDELAVNETTEVGPTQEA